MVRERSVEFNLKFATGDRKYARDPRPLAFKCLSAAAWASRLAGPDHEDVLPGLPPWIHHSRPELGDDGAAAFLHSVVDRDVDFGNDLKGIDVMVSQGVAYSSLLRS